MVSVCVLSVYLCVCVRVCMRALCVCVCVRARARGREGIRVGSLGSVWGGRCKECVGVNLWEISRPCGGVSFRPYVSGVF